MKKRLKPNKKIVRVDWVDSCARSGWTEKKDCIDDNSMIQHSVGFLVNEDKDKITLSSCIQYNEAHVRAPITIPKSAIILKKVL